MKINDAIESFLEYLKATDRSDDTIHNYRGHLERFNKYLCDKYNYPLPVDQIKPDAFEKYLYEPPNDKNLEPQSRQVITIAFKSFCTFCFNKGYVETNIGKKVILIKARAKERFHISEEEMLEIVNAIGRYTYKIIIQMLFYSGLRFGEALNLMLEDVNLDENYIYIRKQKSMMDRKVPINYKLREVLIEYLEGYRNGLNTDSGRFFIFNCKDRSAKTLINRAIHGAAEKAGLNLDITSHTMRHSFASNLISKGVDIVKIQKLLGHESVKITSIYLHGHLPTLKEAVNTL